MLVFPFKICCFSHGGGAYEYQNHMLKGKPSKLSWYAYDTIVHSRTSVEFVLYSMLDSFSGGISKEIARFKCVIPADVTAKDVERQIIEEARLMREKELRDAEEKIIARYADKIRKALDLPLTSMEVK